MQLNNLCAPAMLYVVFSITQIIIDIFKNLYNTAFLKFLVMIVFTIALNLLCQMGLGVVSWLIVFVPFIMMTIITTLLLFVMGLSPSKGRNRVKVDHLDHERHHEAKHWREQHEPEVEHKRRPYANHDGWHHDSSNLYEAFDGYDTDGKEDSNIWEYHELRIVENEI